MNSIVSILVIITIATTWVDYARPLIDKWDYKPFNCSFLPYLLAIINLFFNNFKPNNINNSVNFTYN